VEVRPTEDVVRGLRIEQLFEDLYVLGVEQGAPVFARQPPAPVVRDPGCSSSERGLSESNPTVFA